MIYQQPNQVQNQTVPQRSQPIPASQGNGGFTAPPPTSGLNPNLGRAVDAVSQKSFRDFNTKFLPKFNAGVGTVGGAFGGDRHALMTGQAYGDLMSGIQEKGADLAFTAYESDAERALKEQMLADQLAQQKYEADQRDALGYANIDSRFNIASMQNDLGYAKLTSSEGMHANSLQNALDIAGMNNASRESISNNQLANALEQVRMNNTSRESINNANLDFDYFRQDRNDMFRTPAFLEQTMGLGSNSNFDYINSVDNGGRVLPGDPTDLTQFFQGAAGTSAILNALGGN